MASTDPLGYFPEMKNIKVLEGDDYAQLYRDVLIDTPVGPYFMRFLEESMEGLVENRTTNDVLNLFKDMKAEFINTFLELLLKKCGWRISTNIVPLNLTPLVRKCSSIY